MSELDAEISVLPYATVASAAVDQAIDEVFFQSSGTQAFASEAARAAFRQRWLGRYLRGAAEHTFVAMTGDGEAVGYLVGGIVDPALDEASREIGYFGLLADATAQYPAHLHVNLAAAYRNRGIGERLVQAFAVHASQLGAPGVHIVTGAAARNVGFYRRCGFHEVRDFDWSGRPLVMLGRKLLPTPPPIRE